MAAPAPAPVPDPTPNVTAAYGEGKPFRPEAFQFAELISHWDHVDAPDMDIPQSSDWGIVSWASTSGKNSRIDLTGWAGWRQRRIFGYVASFVETTSENTDGKAYRFEVVSKIPFISDAHRDRSGDADSLSWLWVKTRCYSSSGLIPPPNTVVRLGAFVQGFASACYNGRNRATLEARSLVDWHDWENTSADALIAHNDVDTSHHCPIFGGRRGAPLSSPILGSVKTYLFRTLRQGVPPFSDFAQRGRRILLDLPPAQSALRGIL